MVHCAVPRPRSARRSPSRNCRGRTAAPGPSKVCPPSSASGMCDAACAALICARGAAQARRRVRTRYRAASQLLLDHRPGVVLHVGRHEYDVYLLLQRHRQSRDASSTSANVSGRRPGSSCSRRTPASGAPRSRSEPERLPSVSVSVNDGRGCGNVRRLRCRPPPVLSFNSDAAGGANSSGRGDQQRRRHGARDNTLHLVAPEVATVPAGRGEQADDLSRDVHRARVGEVQFRS